MNNSIIENRITNLENVVKQVEDEKQHRIDTFNGNKLMFIKIKENFTTKYKEIIENITQLIDQLTTSNTNDSPGTENPNPAAKPIINLIWSYSNSKIYTHPNNGTGKVVSTTEMLPELYEVRVRFNKIQKQNFTVVGLTHEPINVDQKNYLGDAFGKGNIGFGTKGIVSCEGSYKYYTGEILAGDILTIKGSGNYCTFFINDIEKFEYTLQVGERYYLACNCIYQDELEILD